MQNSRSLKEAFDYVLHDSTVIVYFCWRLKRETSSHKQTAKIYPIQHLYKLWLAGRSMSSLLDRDH